MRPALDDTAHVACDDDGGLNQPLFLFLNGSILGFVLALLVNWRGNLRAAMAIHFLIDAVQLTLVPT
jgi:membrane protease YdiL (CAAX protease family)